MKTIFACWERGQKTEGHYQKEGEYIVSLEFVTVDNIKP